MRQVVGIAIKRAFIDPMTEEPGDMIVVACTDGAVFFLRDVAIDEPLEWDEYPPVPGTPAEAADED